MRTLILAVAALLTAAPALAQPDLGLQHRQNELWAQQQLDRQRAVSQANELQTLDAQIRTERSLQDLRAQDRTPPLPDLATPRAVTSPPPALKLPSIPDDRLDASNAAVREAARNRR